MVCSASNGLDLRRKKKEKKKEKGKNGEATQKEECERVAPSCRGFTSPPLVTNQASCGVDLLSRAADWCASISIVLLADYHWPSGRPVFSGQDSETLHCRHPQDSSTTDLPPFIRWEVSGIPQLRSARGSSTSFSSSALKYSATNHRSGNANIVFDGSTL